MVQFIRDGQKVWPFCTDCGCRLEFQPQNSGITHVSHYMGETEDTDARGCKCSLLNKTAMVDTSTVEYMG